MTPTVAADQLDVVRQQMEKFHTALNNVASAFNTFNIGDEKLAPGECEIGMLVPRDAVNNRLIDFTEELEELGFILNTFAEIATGQPDDIVIKTLSSTALLVYLKAGWKFAECLARGVERVVDLYKRLLRLRKSLADLQDQGVPKESAEGIHEYANQHMDKGIEELSVEIVNTFYKKEGDDGRKNELKIKVRLSLNAIANRIDKGYNIEVRCAPLADGDDTPENAEKKAAISAVQAATANMQFLNLEGQPLLALPEPVQEKPTKTETREPAKQAKASNRRTGKKRPAQGAENVPDEE